MTTLPTTIVELLIRTVADRSDATDLSADWITLVVILIGLVALIQTRPGGST